MPKIILTFLSFLCMILMFSQDSYSQQFTSKDNSEYYKVFDEIVGVQNTKIYNGTEIIEAHRVSNEKNKYFFKDSFVSSTVIFDGQPFYNIDLNYNIFEDLIVVRLKNKVGKIAFKPIQEKVQGFIYNNYKFINFTSLNSLKLNGYYQVLEEKGDYRLLKKYRLKRKSNLDKEVLFYEFKSMDGEYFILKDEMLSGINSKSEWIKLFPNEESAIRKYFRKNRKLRKLYLDEFIENLFFSTTN